ncbi:LPXTG cell wall anchor domain-containing protein [Anaerobacillus alkaliphilus]|uniref:LPXTG cell wall anchor domain-containing protein n=1 Tax=Anaerobacillus alkaliphilus TaxID=1548597 RepID=A0A4Q0VVJ4_9BACI|nr:LPXTG cell wall anchor domain-containing protein [Anaerobacillus alkaliphilus]
MEPPIEEPPVEEPPIKEPPGEDSVDPPTEVSPEFPEEEEEYEKPDLPTSDYGSTLPQTGETNPIYYYIIGAIITLFGIGLFRRQRVK